MGTIEKVRFRFQLLLFFTLISQAHAVEVTFLTQDGPKVLKVWTPEMLGKLAKKGGKISAQGLLMDDSAMSLELKDRADIDLITVYGEKGMARVPRFMVWRGAFEFHWDAKTSTLSSVVHSKPMASNFKNAKMIVPKRQYESLHHGG